jgi:putative transposase
MDVADFDDIADAATVLRRLPGWFNDYNEHAPHRALGMLSPREFRRREAA